MVITNVSISVMLLSIAVAIQWVTIVKLNKEVKNLTFMVGLITEANHDALMKNLSDKLSNITKNASRK